MQFIQIKVKGINSNLELMLPILVMRMFMRQWYQEQVDIPWESTGHSRQEAGRHSLGTHGPFQTGGRLPNCRHSPFHPLL